MIIGGEILNKIKLGILSLLTISLFLTLNVKEANAHSSCKSYGESYGYWIDCKNHSGSNRIYYNTGSLDSKYSSYITGGQKKWNSTSIVLIGENANYSSNFIHTYTDKNTSTNAAFYNYSSNSAGHLTKWSIKMNKAKMDKRTSAENKTTLAHEFGHVIGLNDLKQTQNKKYLMYGYSERTVSSPTTTDKTGAKKALGL